MLLIKQGFGCYYCGKAILIGTQDKQALATTDHLIPLWLEGEPYGENLVAACSPCNNQKGPLTAEEFTALRNSPSRLRAARRRASIEARAQANDLIARQAVRRRQRLAMGESRQRLYDALRPVIDRNRKHPEKFLSDAVGDDLARLPSSLR